MSNEVQHPERISKHEKESVERIQEYNQFLNEYQIQTTKELSIKGIYSLANWFNRCLFTEERRSPRNYVEGPFNCYRWVVNHTFWFIFRFEIETLKVMFGQASMKQQEEQKSVKKNSSLKRKYYDFSGAGVNIDAFSTDKAELNLDFSTCDIDHMIFTKPTETKNDTNPFTVVQSGSVSHSNDVQLSNNPNILFSHFDQRFYKNELHDKSGAFYYPQKCFSIKRPQLLQNEESHYHGLDSNLNLSYSSIRDLRPRISYIPQHLKGSIPFQYYDEDDPHFKINGPEELIYDYEPVYVSKLRRF